ncbi:histidine phosphatase family protein [Pontibacillus yanchengensis]|uniref:Phosphoglycerate mutase n=1 Tax=Pontibacillus yanchengensis Y32 TaxID=1385514 RepID=A0A0A2TH72_9BACI|nr:histidine phosphatase family protein [Pontibacillus yanchengensis]KGP73421.1 phosphoglycerate mutase [Pontibacillus yanchengensis Y32]
MEFIFIRHGKGEHTENLPNSLQRVDPSLTVEGINQVNLLRQHLPITADDVVVASPTTRTLQTSSILCENVACKKIVHPLVAPRMFPQKSEWSTLPCDRVKSPEEIKKEFPDFEFVTDELTDLWKNGINTLPEKEFRELAENFIEWCKQHPQQRIHVVSHDGTITSYRHLLTNQTLTRNDFLQDGGWIRVTG